MGGPVYFGPVLDMTNLPRHPFWPDAAPQSLHIPMILGNTRDETRAFINPRGPKLAGLGWDNLAERIAPEIKIDLDPHWIVAQYRARHPDWTPERLFYAATTAGRSWPGQVSARSSLPDRSPARRGPYGRPALCVRHARRARQLQRHQCGGTSNARRDDGSVRWAGEDRQAGAGSLGTLCAPSAGDVGDRQRHPHDRRPTRMGAGLVGDSALCAAGELARRTYLVISTLSPSPSGEGLGWG
jgi:hypothetical protein